jgi:hypothetical protein
MNKLLIILTVVLLSIYAVTKIDFNRYGYNPEKNIIEVCDNKTFTWREGNDLYLRTIKFTTIRIDKPYYILYDCNHKIIKIIDSRKISKKTNLKNS